MKEKLRFLGLDVHAETIAVAGEGLGAHCSHNKLLLGTAVIQTRSPYIDSALTSVSMSFQSRRCENFREKLNVSWGANYRLPRASRKIRSNVN